MGTGFTSGLPSCVGRINRTPTLFEFGRAFAEATLLWAPENGNG